MWLYSFTHTRPPQISAELFEIKSWNMGGEALVSRGAGAQVETIVDVKTGIGGFRHRHIL